MLVIQCQLLIQIHSSTLTTSKRIHFRATLGPGPSNRVRRGLRTILRVPVEKLSKFHLELYQCLTSVKAVERKKKRKNFGAWSSGSEIPIDTSWSEHLFQTAERFLDALQGYVGIGLDTSDAMHMADAGQNTHTQIDVATGLMIVSCYTRLLQIFEVVVFVVEMFREMDCPGAYVQISPGSFQRRTISVCSLIGSVRAALAGEDIGGCRRGSSVTTAV